MNKSQQISSLKIDVARLQLKVKELELQLEHSQILCEGLAARVAAQSELLSKHAGKVPDDPFTMPMQPDEVRILYTNYRGETSWRRINPQQCHYGSNDWHPQAQWLLHAWDVEKQKYLTFALLGIHQWKFPPVPEITQ